MRILTFLVKNAQKSHHILKEDCNHGNINISCWDRAKCPGILKVVKLGIVKYFCLHLGHATMCSTWRVPCVE